MLELFFFNAGHGDSTAIKFPGGEWGIIDCNKNTNALEPNVLRFLKQKGVKWLKFICITHPHTDHFYGFDNIIQYFGSSNIEKLILYGLNTGHHNEYDEKSSLAAGLVYYIKSIPRNKIKEKIKIIKTGDKISAGDVHIICCNPDAEMITQIQAESYIKTKSEYNNISVVLIIEYSGVRILLTGDASGSIIENKKGILSDIVKIPHHGSKHNNPESFLIKAVRKDKSYSIISSGYKYNLPDKNVVSYLRSQLHSNVYLTSEISKKNISMNFAAGFELDDTEKNMLSELGEEDTENTANPDGYIKICIDDCGNIKTAQYEKIDKN